ncbi:MAG: transketolase [Firmicutes bacterium]|nr:transketolase [Bacillota bacterium]
MNAFNREKVDFLRAKAWELRADVVEMIYGSEGSSGHFGGSLSAAEIVSVLYWEIMRVDPARPDWEDRDRLVLSKGHSVPIVYAALAHKGYFDRSVLKTYRDDGSILQGHPDCRKTPGLNMSSGSLGQGLSVALGMALSARQAGKDFQVYVLLSDGELQEGMVWEAAMAASHYGTGNLTAIVDYNNMQVDATIAEIMKIEPLQDKWRAFGWDCLCVDGHDVESLLAAFAIRRKHRDRPFALICRTVKGKGVSFMENNADWHCTRISKEERDQALAELAKGLAECRG